MPLEELAIGKPVQPDDLILDRTEWHGVKSSPTVRGTTVRSSLDLSAVALSNLRLDFQSVTRLRHHPAERARQSGNSFLPFNLPRGTYDGRPTLIPWA